MRRRKKIEEKERSNWPVKQIPAAENLASSSREGKKKKDNGQPEDRLAGEKKKGRNRTCRNIFLQAEGTEQTLARSQEKKKKKKKGRFREKAAAIPQKKKEKKKEGTKGGEPLRVQRISETLFDEKRKK